MSGFTSFSSEEGSRNPTGRKRIRVLVRSGAAGVDVRSARRAIARPLRGQSFAELVVLDYIMQAGEDICSMFLC
jgi:hypothetical protein